MNDSEKFYDILHMTPAQFEYLYNLVKPKLLKRSRRKPVHPELKLALTLQ